MSIQDKNDLFISVIESHKGILYKISNAYCKDSEDRKDLIQEIYIQLWKSFDNFNDDYKYSTWIYRISLNVAISFYRKEKSRSKISNPYNIDVFEVADTENNEDEESNLGILQKFIIYQLVIYNPLKKLI